MDRKLDPVGVFDSGVGGISALREMRRVLPSETFIYYGDIRNAPYGTKSTDEVSGYARAVVKELLDQKIKALVIACNTATGAAAATLRRELTIPVIGMEPALKPASEVRKNGRILVLATPLTLHQEKFNRLMELVENEDFDGAEQYLRELFAGFDMEHVDAVVLGCTHYVFLKDMIRDMIPDRIAITEGSEGTARQLRRVLQKNELLNEQGEGRVILQTSGTEKDILLMRKLLETDKMGR